MNDNTAAMQDFLSQYNDLCERTGFRLILNPVFVPTNHGSFEIGTQYAIGLLPRKEEPASQAPAPQAQTVAAAELQPEVVSAEVKPEVTPATPVETTPEVTPVAPQPQFETTPQPALQENPAPVVQ